MDVVGLSCWHRCVGNWQSCAQPYVHEKQLAFLVYSTLLDLWCSYSASSRVHHLPLIHRRCVPSWPRGPYGCLVYNVSRDLFVPQSAICSNSLGGARIPASSKCAVLPASRVLQLLDSINSDASNDPSVASVKIATRNEHRHPFCLSMSRPLVSKMIESNMGNGRMHPTCVSHRVSGLEASEGRS